MRPYMGAMHSSSSNPGQVPRIVRRSQHFLHIVLFSAAAWAQISNHNLPLLTHADQVRRLSPDQAALGYPVRVSGVVTDDVPAPDFFIQDSSAGVYVEGVRSESY